jgi:hypothetical protein
MRSLIRVSPLGSPLTREEGVIERVSLALNGAAGSPHVTASPHLSVIFPRGIDGCIIIIMTVFRESY